LLGREGAQQAFLLPLIGVAVKAVAGGAIGSAIGRAGSWVGKQVGSSTGRAVVGGAAAAGAGAVITSYAGGGYPPPPPPGMIPGYGSPQLPEGPISRTISRILPGGKSGKEYQPFEGTEINRYGQPIAVYPDKAERWKAPPGYVIVYPWGPDQQPIAMLKGAARAMGLWHPAPKPPVSGWDMRAIQRAHSAGKRVKSLAKKVGLSVSAKRGR
jgi:hypothetical protein